MADSRGRHRRPTHTHKAAVLAVLVTMAVVAPVSVLVIAADTGMPAPAARIGGGAPHLVVSPASRANVPAGWTP